MKERENERLQFWREELPHQIELARNGWMLEAEARTKVNLDRVRRECQTEFDAQMAVCMQQHKAELDILRKVSNLCHFPINFSLSSPNVLKIKLLSAS